jgi:uncharacterized membrane protein (DUF2068 family)
VRANSKPKRPRSVTLFSLGVLLFGGGLNLARAAWAWRQADALTELSASTSMPMALLGGTSLLWGVVFVACSLGLWRLRLWGRTGTLVAVTLFHVHIWLNHAVFDRSDYARQVWPFAVLHTLATLFFVWGFLYRSSIRRLYAEQERIDDPRESRAD